MYLHLHLGTRALELDTSQSKYWQTLRRVVDFQYLFSYAGNEQLSRVPSSTYM